MVFIQEVFQFHDRYPYFLELIQRAEVVCRGNDKLAANRQGFIRIISEMLRSFDPSVSTATLDRSAVALMGMTRAILQVTPRRAVPSCRNGSLICFCRALARITEVGVRC